MFPRIKAITYESEALLLLIRVYYLYSREPLEHYGCEPKHQIRLRC